MQEHGGNHTIDSTSQDLPFDLEALQDAACWQHAGPDPELPLPMPDAVGTKRSSRDQSVRTNLWMGGGHVAGLFK